MSGSTDVSAKVLPPVTVLCGFLGAGKTTLLNHLLRQAEGRRWAAVVNDVAAINIDATLVKTEMPGSAVVGLGNGCVCCSNRDDLAETIARLTAEGAYEHILVETSGVAEPRGIASLFMQKNQFGRSMSDFAQLSALVSVIDAAHFLKEWRAQGVGSEVGRTVPVSRFDKLKALSQSQGRGSAGTPRPTKNAGESASAGFNTRPVFELMVEQVECADVIVLNKCDLVSEEERAQLEAIIGGLNERAELIRTEQGQVSREFLLERVRFDPAVTLGAARWVKILNALPSGGELVAKPGGRPVAVKTTPRHTERYGITSWVFQARRPFVQAKFEALCARGIPGLLRAKGFFWLAERPDELGFLSVTGGVVRTDFPSYWWAAMIESGRAQRSDLPAVLEKQWIDPTGDRRQELVFIGVALDELELESRLSACLEQGIPQ